MSKEEDYMRDLLSKRGLGNLNFVLSPKMGHVFVKGDEQMIRPQQIQQMMETQTPARDYGIVNNQKVISSDLEIDKIIHDYWKNYRASMQAGNGIEVLVENGFEIRGLEDITKLKNIARTFLWIDTLGDIGNDEDAIRRNDAFVNNVGVVILYTLQQALNKTRAKF
tara:strand:- start:1104 stop:1601 length:498 start_codon:yes stop_codon:yes gene_type:complete